MSSKDDPSGSGDKTIIRPSLARPPKADGREAAAPLPVSVEDPGATVFDPASIQSPPPGWSSGTVIYQGTSFAVDSPAQSGEADIKSAELASAATRKIPLDVLLGAEGKEYVSANPFIAAAAPLLILFGHLRLMAPEIEASPLAAHIAAAIEEFERRIADAGIPAEDARIAKFVLCETADDIVGNLPGFDKQVWKPHAMLSHFFQAGTPGAGFFRALNKMLAEPEAHHDLLELMHSCLALGFEGQYRGLPREDGSLQRVRQDVYDTLRYFKPRPGDEISPHWQGLSAAMQRTGLRVPLWSLAAATLALLVGAFFAMRIAITNQGDALADELLALSPSTPVVIERATFVPLTEEVKPAATAQIDRVRTALAQDIQAGGLTVATKGDFIVVEVNNLMLFASGKADIKAEFEPVAGRIAAALDPEPGPIRIVGHTDNVKPRKSSVFKSNYDLSVARAKAVEKVVASKLADPSRIAVEGKGEEEPIADNATPEGRTRNRRVDLMIPREETL
jgi:type VI secretion system protein ImpK